MRNLEDALLDKLGSIAGPGESSEDDASTDDDASTEHRHSTNDFAVVCRSLAHAVLSGLRLLVWVSAVLQGGFALQASTE